MNTVLRVRTAKLANLSNQQQQQQPHQLTTCVHVVVPVERQHSRRCPHGAVVEPIDVRRHRLAVSRLLRDDGEQQLCKAGGS